jgi:hypothetical protein
MAITCSEEDFKASSRLQRQHHPIACVLKQLPACTHETINPGQPRAMQRISPAVQLSLVNVHCKQQKQWPAPTWQRSSLPPSVPTTTSEASSCAVAAGQKAKQLPPSSSRISAPGDRKRPTEASPLAPVKRTPQACQKHLLEVRALAVGRKTKQQQPRFTPGCAAVECLLCPPRPARLLHAQ